MSTTTLRPNATTTATATIVGGSASIHAALSDDSDSTYISSITEARVGLTDTAFPATDVVKQTRVRFRYSTGGFSVLLFVEVDDIFSGSNLSISSSSFAEYSTSWSSAPVSAAQLNSASALLQSGGSTPHIAEFYVDVVHVPLPVVTVAAVSPDPYTASTTIPIAWTNTLDSDGGAQTRYRVYVTDDNDSDAVVFDTGDVLGSVLTIDAGPLTNGDYTAHVRTGQTVNGAAHWSVYDTDSFTVDVDTADVDTCAGVADSVNGRILVTVERDTATEDWDYIEVQRSIDGTSTWQDVRFATYVDCTGDADTFTVYDNEVPNGVQANYRARATRIDGGLAFAGDWVEGDGAGGGFATWTSTTSWLKSPTNPNLNQTVIVEYVAPQHRVSRAGVFPILGSAYPIVVSATRVAPSFPLRLRTETSAKLGELLALLNDTNLLLHRPAAALTGAGQNGAQYIATLDVDDFWHIPAYSDLRVIEVPVQEIAAPADPTAGR